MTVCAKETFAFDAPNGAQVVVRRGQPYPDDHPYVKGREKLFETVEAVAARSTDVLATSGAAAVETATAAPGERRSIVRSKRRSDSSEV